MSEINELYQQIILDHNKNPRNYRAIEHPSALAKGHNPLCGDQIDIFLTVKDDVIADVCFQGQGCAISQSSASLMTTMIKGKTSAEAKILIDLFLKIVRGEISDDATMETIGKLAVFAGVRDYPSRIKCASLAWHTLENAIDNPETTATTE